MQSSQSLSPAVLLYLPVLHAVHDPPLVPHQPALQVQSAKAVLCAGELESVGQLLQSVDPAALLYLPEPHDKHVPPFCPEKPALQVQLAGTVLCSGELE